MFAGAGVRHGRVRERSDSSALSILFHWSLESPMSLVAPHIARARTPCPGGVDAPVTDAEDHRVVVAGARILQRIPNGAVLCLGIESLRCTNRP